MDSINRNFPRVAMYIWRFPPFIGGAETQCKKLSEELVKKGIPVFIVTERIENTKGFEFINGVEIYRVSSLNWLRRLPDKIRHLFYWLRKDKTYYLSLLDDTVRFKKLKSISKVLTYDIPNYYFFISSLWTFYKKRNEFDILHVHEAHWIASFGVQIARLLNKKVIVKEAMAGDLMTFNEQSIKSKKRVMQADCFIAISNKILADLISVGIADERIVKIPNGINFDGCRWQLRPSEEKAVICITKINQLPNKGIDILFKAWRILIQGYNKRIGLQVFGRGDPYLQRQLAIQLGIEKFVSFPGFVDNVKQHLLDSYLFVLPSRAEGLSNALLEAMSLGLPCVATDVSGNQDLIQNGINGLLVPGENPGALAKAVLFMLDNPGKASEMGYNARKTIEQQYTISNIADRYIELYKELAN